MLVLIRDAGIAVCLREVRCRLALTIELSGQACESPLLVAVAAGSLALPTLLKLATVMAGQNQDFLTCSQLPVVSVLFLTSIYPSHYACPSPRLKEK